MSKLSISSAVTGASPALEGIGDVGLNALRKQAAKAAIGMAEQSMNNSYVQATKSMRIQPITVIDHTLLSNPVIENLNQVLLNIFIAYYLQAIARDNVVGKVSVFRRLDRLNPNRSAAQSVLNNSMVILDALEGYYDFQLPTMPKRLSTHAERQAVKFAMESLSVGLEADERLQPNYFKPGYDAETADGKPDMEIRKENAKVRDVDDAIGSGASILLDKVADRNQTATIDNSVLKDLSNLAIGKIVNVELHNGDSKVTVPVAFRLMTSSMIPSLMVDMLAYSTRKAVTLKERWHAWRSGRIQFWRDFMFARDQIRDEIRYNASTKDKDKIYQKIQERKQSNMAAGAASGNPTMANISNIIVINKATLSQLEASIGGRLQQFSVREKLFADSGIMIFVVVDTDNNRVRMYFHSIEEHTDMSFNELARDAKKDNANLTDLLQMMMQGSAPRL